MAAAFKLVEDTVYSDGEKHRVWKSLQDRRGRYVGQRADLIGQANVEAHGNRIENRLSRPCPDEGWHDPRPEFQGNLRIHAVRDG